LAGDSKTEKATPKKRRDERKKGNIFVSKDVTIVVSLLGMFFILRLLLPRMYSTIKEFLLQIMWYTAEKSELTMDFAADLQKNFIVTLLSVALPILMMAALIAIVVTMAQTKMLFSTDSLKPKFSRLNPLEGIKRLFALKSFVEVIKACIKISILLAIIYRFFVGQISNFARTLSMDLVPATVFILNDCMKLVLRIGIAFIAISVLDYFYQWWEYERQLKMSKQEVKEEYKQMEGDPQIKGKIKENQRRMAMSRMMQAVPSADVIIKNPTHFAVALRYDTEKDAAPVVVAKGQDELALRIIKTAEDNHVHVIENKPLARALYATTELNREIPAEFYGTIAEILVYVYKLNNKKIL
jgi:flagellar biosynthetic protein FlhB